MNEHFKYGQEVVVTSGGYFHTKKGMKGTVMQVHRHSCVVKFPVGQYNINKQDLMDSSAYKASKKKTVKAKPKHPNKMVDTKEPSIENK